MDDKLIARHAMKSEDGRSFVVYEWQEYIDASSFGSQESIPGLKYLELEDGTKVNHIDDDTFKIVVSGTILKRVD